MLFDLINTEKLRRAAAYGLLLIAVLFVQSCVLSRIAPLGVRALLLPAAVVIVAVLEGDLWGGVFGLLLGLLSDRLFLENTVLFTVLFPVVGFLVGLLAEEIVNARFFSCFVLCAAVLLFTAFCQLFRPLFFLGAEPWPLIRAGLLQTLWALPLVPLLYFPCRGISHRFHRNDR